MSDFNIFKMLRFVESHNPKYNAAITFHQDEHVAPYRDLKPYKDMYGYVTDEGVQGIWFDFHDPSDLLLYDYKDNYMIRKFKNFKNTENLKWEWVYDLETRGAKVRFNEYYENGQLMMTKPWENHNVHGDVIMYYPSGDIKSKSTYKDGIMVSREEYDDQWADN